MNENAKCTYNWKCDRLKAPGDFICSHHRKLEDHQFTTTLQNPKLQIFVCAVCGKTHEVYTNCCGAPLTKAERASIRYNVFGRVTDCCESIPLGHMIRR